MLARARVFGHAWWNKNSLACSSTSRLFTSSAAIGNKNKPLPPRAHLDESEVEEKFLKGTGPGGQKINKTNSAVQLHHVPTGIVIKCQDTRSRDQNRKLARRKLVDRLEELEKGEQARSVIKAQVKARKSASREKKSKRKYRALEAQKALQTAEIDDAPAAVEEGNNHETSMLESEKCEPGDHNQQSNDAESKNNRP